ncbi:MAG: hypothetical protein KDB27_06350 [Planctomycetales bacterium]|nr:hypothetical protein [Planctomycetales bacterium]
MVIRHFAKLTLFVSLALLATSSLSAKEYVYVQQDEGAIPPEPFIDDLDLGADLSDELSQQSDTSPFGEDDVATPTTDCPPIDKLLQEIIPAKSMSASIISTTTRPADCSEGLFLPPRVGIARTTNITQFNWQASNFLHRPLYFDDTPLERYGQSRFPVLQPVVSGAKFFGTFAVLPYKMGIDRTGDCVSSLGYYRPGSCAPCIRERVIPAFEADAALLEAGTAVALIFILP